MWRYQSIHERGETESFSDAMNRIHKDKRLYTRANSFLDAVAKSEPIIADALTTPQSIRYHGEGPYLRSHYISMLQVLYAIEEEKFHFVDIEEFRRMRGFEGELDELEETIKENLALMEVFVLCHDAAKWATVSFSAKEESKGLHLGFSVDESHHWEDEGFVHRAEMRKRYLELFEEFVETHHEGPDQKAQEEFFHEYGISVHYPGHDRMIHSPLYRQLLVRIGEAHGLNDREIALLEDIIGHHLEPLTDFRSVQPKKIKRYHLLANKHGFDADDFLDVFQGCFFLDAVCGSQKFSLKDERYQSVFLERFLRSEHEYAPWLREQKKEKREQKEQRERNRLFKKVGLDGISLMDLLELPPGPEFGVLLRAIHDAILGRTDWPAVSSSAQSELERRTEAFYELAFGHEQI
jgi:hypothetical protein